MTEIGTAKTVAQLTTEIQSTLASSEGISASQLRQVLLDIINSFANTALQTISVNPSPVLTNTNTKTAGNAGVLCRLGSVTGTDTSDFIAPYNVFDNQSDTANLQNGVNVLSFLNFGGASMVGSRYGILSDMVQKAGSGNSPPNSTFYIPVGSDIQVSFNDGGTGLTSTTANSAVQASNFIAQLQNGATNYYQACACEMDVSVATGASVWRKEGVLIAQLSTDAVSGSAVDAALVVANQPGAIGWSVGVQFGNVVAGGLASTGTLIKGQGINNSVNWGTIGHGIDLSGFSITNDAFLTKGFKVAGANVGTAFTNYNQATPAGGGAAGIALGSAVLGIYWGSGAPTISAPQGSIYLRSDGVQNARLYINTDGGTTWTAFNTTT